MSDLMRQFILGTTQWRSEGCSKTRSPTLGPRAIHVFRKEGEHLCSSPISASPPGHMFSAAAERNYDSARRRSILACMGVLAALAGPPAWAQTWPNPADLRDFARAEAHEAKLDARVRRHRPSPGNRLSTAYIEDTLAATQFRMVARAAKIGHARKISIALRIWKPELYAAWRACEEGQGARAACTDIELQYGHARTAVSYVLAQREAAAWQPGADLSPELGREPPPPGPPQRNQ